VQILCKLSYLYGMAMNTNITISLDTRRQKSDGTFPIVLRLGHNGLTTAIPIGIGIKEKDWDENNRSVRKSYTGISTVSRLNNLIQSHKKDAMDIILKLQEQEVLNTLSVVELKAKIVKQNKSQSFFEFASTLIVDLIASNKIGTARSYKGLVDVLKKYVLGKNLSFTDISYSFLIKFENNHIQKGNAYNGLAVYMRTIRAIFNKAINVGVIEKEVYPFATYKIKTEPTQKRALDWELLKVIIQKDIPQTDLCFHPRNYFLASYMMYGMNFTDMAFLKKTDLIHNRIQYRRKKTSKFYDIKVTPNLEKILTYYIDLHKESEYIFPVVKRDTAILQDKDIQWARKRYNKKLKLLATACGIDTNLTSYVSRHSFATQAMLADVPIKAISSMLGHSSLKTTEIYLKSLPSNVLDDYNEKVMQFS
jgi:integrase/recombinase XerD